MIEAKGHILDHENQPKNRKSGINPVSAVERIKNLIEITEDCWKWIGSKDKKGYGRMWIRGKGNTPAHRVSYEIYIGNIPDGLCVLHKCDNPECVNPKHLFLGTLVDNNKDMRNKRRHAYGEKQGHAKITLEIANKIRNEYIPYEISYKHLGDKYGIAPETVRDIIKGYTWVNNIASTISTNSRKLNDPCILAQ